MTSFDIHSVEAMSNSDIQAHIHKARELRSQAFRTLVIALFSGTKKAFAEAFSTEFQAKKA